MKFDNLKIRTLLLAGFGMILTVMVLLVALALGQMHKADVLTAKLTSESFHRASMLQEWQAIIETNAARTLAAIKVADPGDEKFFLDAIATASKRSDVLHKAIKESIAGDGQAMTLFEAVNQQREAYRSARKAVMAKKAAGDLEGVRKFLDTEMVPRVQSYNEAVGAMVSYQQGAVAKDATLLQDEFAASKRLQIALTVAALLAGVGFAWWIGRRISAPLTQAVSVAQTVARGDLTSRIEVQGANETGALMGALRDMNANLVDIVSQVRSGTGAIAEAADQISAGNLELSARTEQQAGSLEETASSMEELTSTVRQNADNAREANALAQSASQVAGRGGDTVGRVVDTMEAITQSSKKIADIIGVIDGIAFQTNILALNAAVEAARAGEQGRGFAVVASEVRNLAQRSAGAAKEIKELIGDSVGKVEEGSRLVASAGATMHEIVDSIGRVTTIMAQIALASQEQSAGIEQVNGAIAQMDQVTQQNAALVEEAAAASDAMREQAQALAQVVSTFRFDERAVRPAVPAARHLALQHAA
ncbi:MULTISPECIES: methyl-accepting chemotaxis protein [unclassified Massilia]|uniref:methyl-accepting chemotaxis protein n=1 Tax=unclassified Massilia TaxID=2609279 RepID=UPI0017871DC7|nr:MULTISPECIES: methyl-accepting chemotaxis protein [unclassified Massilia]MBD8529619.1 MCP four helix bundle domain-containing protein [Massilia sp. CFBP 13647]MBD8673294.1 MCP four helix bundle domain-containing protein [Massilia sp. CFBP 13721]